MRGDSAPDYSGDSLIHSPNTKKIPTYGPDGSRIRDYTIDAIERLEYWDRIVVQRNKHEVIVSAHFRCEDGTSPLPKTVHMGQKYSYPYRLPDTIYHVWQHKSTPQDNACDLFVRRIFRSAVLDNLTVAKDPVQRVAPTKAATVIQFPTRGINRERRRIDEDETPEPLAA